MAGQSELPEVFDPSFDFTTASWRTGKINETIINYVRTDEGHAVCEGDMLLSIEDEEREREGQRPLSSPIFHAIITKKDKWKNGIVPYIFDENLDQELKTLATNAMERIVQKVASIRFVKRTNERDYVRIQKSSTGGYSSFVGRIGGEQKIDLTLPWSTPLGSAQHEFLHCLGLYHEQSREDRDKWVIVNINDNNYEKRAPKYGTDYGDYDLGSIMHYPLSEKMGLTKEGVEYTTAHRIRVGQRSGLSDDDVKALQSIYGNMHLYGTTVPEPGKTYAIHPHSLEDGGASTAVTVEEDTSVTMRAWGETPKQKWECVEKDGWLGFICRASTASDRGAYLGYDASEVLVCTAQSQDKWEDFQYVKHDQGCEWEMRKDDHLAYVGIVDNTTLKMLRDRNTRWGFTEWLSLD